MTLTPSRLLSVVVVGADYLRAWSIPLSAWYVTVLAVPLLILIWFPAALDDVSYGLWYKGYRVDSHTPAIIIAAFGWTLLLAFTACLFNPRILTAAIAR